MTDFYLFRKVVISKQLLFCETTNSSCPLEVFIVVGVGGEGCGWGWALIRGWALIKFSSQQDGRLFEAGANLRLGA